ncbi:hypothetical protein FB45DRAFT_915300 [Roridomyces roridus]|uniref:Uncharacterized protein n=1 Tax=Roridomyces roridus TaxID=1738132 RepID=A0AAD7BUE1_9AGAR|nr:hypothetical protein FB45DRAFT_915300 [Roridomyces roridus]
MIVLPQALLFLVLELFFPPLAWALPAEVVEPVEPSPPEECMECASNGADAANNAIGSGLPTSVIVAILVVIVILTIVCIYVHYRKQQKAYKVKPANNVSKQSSAGFTRLGSTADVGTVDHHEQTAGLLSSINGRAS